MIFQQIYMVHGGDPNSLYHFSQSGSGSNDNEGYSTLYKIWEL